MNKELYDFLVWEYGPNFTVKSYGYSNGIHYATLVFFGSDYIDVEVVKDENGYKFSSIS